jgi:hypothetical protein
MSIVATNKLMFLFADEQNRTYYFENGVVKKSAQPRWLKQNPNGWKDMTIQFATNQTYFATLRAFTNALKFIEDGQAIILDRLLNGRGTQEILYLIILRNDPSKGLNYYGLEYKERIDLSKFNGDPRTGSAVNTLQYDVFSLIQANENAMYSIPCNSSNPLAVPVLFDGILLQDKLNYSVANVPIINNTGHFWFAIPFTFVSNEGDSVGVVFNSQNYDNFDNPVTYCQYATNSNNFLVFDVATVVTLRGTFSFKWSALHYSGGGFAALFMTNLDTRPDPNKVVWQNIGPSLGTPLPPFVVGQTYTVAFTKTISLAAHEKLFFLAEMADPEINSLTITPFATTISAVYATKQVPSIAYIVRPLDALQSLVSQITLGRYTADSNFFRRNNRKCVLSGSSLRSFPDANVQTCFADFFKSYSSCYNMGLAVRDGVLWMEPVEDLYNSDTEILRLPNISKPVLTIAEEYYYASARVGYVKQTYNKRNGRYEFNCTHNYTFPISTSLNKMDLVSPYRADSFGMEFIRVGYPDLTTTDDKGDNDVFTVMVSDVIGQAEGVIDNTFPVNIITLILAAPVIKSPFSNTVVYNSYPTISGVSQPNLIITIYADGIADGTTIADANGNWSYQIVSPLRPLSLTFNGNHSITANAQTDPSNISDFSPAVILTVNPALTASFVITSPASGDALYDNLPLIIGTAPQGTAITVKLDGVTIGMVVANSSSLWSFQTTAPIPDGSHSLIASSVGLPDTPAVALTIAADVSIPLITNLLFNQTLYTNTPLLKGVAAPGSTVAIYIDGGGGPIVGGIAGPVGTAVADANGRWQFQFVSMTDPATDLVIGYIPDGLHDFGTTPLPANVSAAISGFRLMRGTNKGPTMDFDSIRLDDAYIPPGLDPSTLPATLGTFLHPETLYNTIETTPYDMLRAHDNILSPFLFQQGGQSILFNGAEVNANFTRSKGGVITAEGASVPVTALSAPLFWPFWLAFTSPVDNSFNSIMTQLQSFGYITVVIKGLEIYLLPIGSMSLKPATDDAQNWKLLVSGKTPFSTLLQLFQNGTPIQIGPNMIYISDRNPLHFVKYDATPASGYHFADIYDDWQKNRFPRYRVYQPDYAQPWQTNDTINLQVVSNGVGSLQVQVISIYTGQVVDIKAFSPVAGAPVTTPNQLQQVSIPLSGYPVGQYWFGLFADGALVGISEKIDLRVDWPNTIKCEYDGSQDKIDFYFSTGIQLMIRVQGELLPWSADSEVDNYEDENGDYQLTRGVPLKTRMVQFGGEDGLIADWMSLKMNQITLLENFRAEGIHLTRDNNSKWEPDDFGQGVPEFLIKIEMILAENQTGTTFSTPGDEDINAVTFTLDATAFGLDEGVINVTADQTS